MGQADILKALKRRRRPVTAKELVVMTKRNRHSVNCALRKLVRNNEVKLERDKNHLRARRRYLLRS